MSPTARACAAALRRHWPTVLAVGVATFIAVTSTSTSEGDLYTFYGVAAVTVVAPFLLSAASLPTFLIMLAHCANIIRWAQIFMTLDDESGVFQSGRELNENFTLRWGVRLFFFGVSILFAWLPRSLSWRCVAVGSLITTDVLCCAVLYLLTDGGGLFILSQKPLPSAIGFCSALSIADAAEAERRQPNEASQTSAEPSSSSGEGEGSRDGGGPSA